MHGVTFIFKKILESKKLVTFTEQTKICRLQNSAVIASDI